MSNCHYIFLKIDILKTFSDITEIVKHKIKNEIKK